MKKLIPILLILVSSMCFGQGEMITITGDSLLGKNINGETVREVIGNVVLVQGNVHITCNHATQYLARNDAILEGNVVIKQDTLTIEAERGFYYGNNRIAECKTGVRLNDGHVILKAINGDYYFNEQRAFFSDNVRMYDTVSTLTSDKLTYFKKIQKMIAVGNVRIQDTVNTIFSDSLEHYRNDKITFAEKNVKITSSENNTEIYGQHLENYARKKYTYITGNPLLVQVDTSTSRNDTLIISSLYMESYNDSSQKFIAKDSVRIWRGEFASRNNYTLFLRAKEQIITYKQKQDESFPILWYQRSQLTGDSINIFLTDNILDSIEVWNNAFILSQNELYPVRYDQISGDKIVMHFFNYEGDSLSTADDSSGIDYTEVTGNVLSIYYMYEENEPNGLTKSSAQLARIYFKNDKPAEVKLYNSPASEYHPEIKVEKNELSFTLPGFRIFGNRPDKAILLNNIITDL